MPGLGSGLLAGMADLRKGRKERADMAIGEAVAEEFPDDPYGQLLEYHRRTGNFGNTTPIISAMQQQQAREDRQASLDARAEALAQHQDRTFNATQQNRDRTYNLAREKFDHEKEQDQLETGSGGRSKKNNWVDVSKSFWKPIGDEFGVTDPDLPENVYRARMNRLLNSESDAYDKRLEGYGARSITAAADRLARHHGQNWFDASREQRINAIEAVLQDAIKVSAWQWQQQQQPANSPDTTTTNDEEMGWLDNLRVWTADKIRPDPDPTGSQSDPNAMPLSDQPPIEAFTDEAGNSVAAPQGEAGVLDRVADANRGLKIGVANAVGSGATGLAQFGDDIVQEEANRGDTQRKMVASSKMKMPILDMSILLRNEKRNVLMNSNSIVDKAMTTFLDSHNNKGEVINKGAHDIAFDFLMRTISAQPKGGLSKEQAFDFKKRLAFILIEARLQQL